MNFKTFFFALFFLSFFSCSDLTVEESFAKAEEEDNRKWYYIHVPDMNCRDGSCTGIGFRANTRSDKLLIYLEGGGACFNNPTCIANPSNFKKIQFAAWKNSIGQLGIFNESNDNNPFKDWNMVYIPYCTGDIHGGTNDKADIGIRKKQKMLGYANVTAVLEELVGYFGEERFEEVFLTGTSAGGYGTLMNAGQVADYFVQSKLTVLNDSGPVLLNQDAQPDCLDEHWETTFDLKVPDDYNDFITGDYGTNLKAIYEYLARKYPDVDFGLAVYTKDLVIREFYGYGDDDCEKLSGFPGPLDGDVFKDALFHVRENVLFDFDNWGSYYINGSSHTLNVFNKSFNNLEVDGHSFKDWVNDLREGNARHVGNY